MKARLLQWILPGAMWTVDELDPWFSCFQRRDFFRSVKLETLRCAKPDAISMVFYDMQMPMLMPMPMPIPPIRNHLYLPSRDLSLMPNPSSTGNALPSPALITYIPNATLKRLIRLLQNRPWPSSIVCISRAKRSLARCRLSGYPHKVSHDAQAPFHFPQPYGRKDATFPLFISFFGDA